MTIGNIKQLTQMLANLLTHSGLPGQPRGPELFIDCHSRHATKHSPRGPWLLLQLSSTT